MHAWNNAYFVAVGMGNGNTIVDGSHAYALHDTGMTALVLQAIPDRNFAKRLAVLPAGSTHDIGELAWFSDVYTVIGRARQLLKRWV
jgi:hypothetical protein